MKTHSQILIKKLMLILAIIWCNISFAQIPNWDMENWTTTTKDAPSQWLTFGSATKVSPGQNGSYAIKLQGNSSQDYNNGPGAVLYGTPGNNNGFDGGTPFTARPDSMVTYFKYSIETGDSAWVIVMLKNHGTIISSDQYAYTGSNTSGFKRMSFKIHYYSTATPDTMFIGFTSTIPNKNNGSINTVSWVILDNISFIGTTQNVLNPDFENWTTQSNYSLNGWENNSSGSGTNVMRTTDVYAGNYAMKLQGYTQTIGPNSNNNNGNWGPTFAINSTPTSLKGFYKFIPQNGDSFDIYIGLWKNGQSVGGGGFNSLSTVNTYTPFSVPINYNNTPPQAPDSATIQIQFRTGNNPRGLSVAYIDNLSFDQFIHTGIVAATTQIKNLNIYPNPTNSKLNISFQFLQKEKVAISIYNYNGSEVMKLTEQNFDVGNHELNFNVEQLSNGIYFLVTQTGTSISHSKLMIVK
jgi:hypothetical protein